MKVKAKCARALIRYLKAKENERENSNKLCTTKLYYATCRQRVCGQNKDYYCPRPDSSTTALPPNRETFCSARKKKLRNIRGKLKNYLSCVRAESKMISQNQKINLALKPNLNGN